MRTIIMTVGLPASGKDSWAAEEMAKHPGKYKRVNKDLIREMLDFSRYTPEIEKFTRRVRNNIVDISLSRGFDVIISDTNLNPKHFQDVVELAEKHGDVRIFEKYFDVSLKECLARNEKREKKIPDQAIIDMHNRYIKNGKVQMRDVYIPPIKHEYKRDPKKQDIIIVDIDGTLALNESGRDYYDMSRVKEDTLNMDLADLIETYSEARGCYVFIVSGREEASRQDTMEWLSSNHVEYHKLLMRSDGDRRADTITKREIYEKEIAQKYNTLFVIDDRMSVCDMWRSLGLTVMQVSSKIF